MNRGEHLEKAREALVRAEQDLARARVEDRQGASGLGLAAQELELSQQWASLASMYPRNGS